MTASSLFSPVPYLAKGFPYLRIDPDRLAAKRVDFVLATDDVRGSRSAHVAGEWIEAAVVPGAFVVNIGDCLMRWANDIYVSTPHRVVTRSVKERFSIAFF